MVRKGSWVQIPVVAPLTNYPVLYIDEVWKKATGQNANHFARFGEKNQNGLSHYCFYAGMVEWSNTSDCKSDGVRLRGFKSLSLHQ